MIVFPNAKINIGLNIVSKRDDGYHNLETIFCPVKIFDALEFIEAENTLLTFSGITVDGKTEENLILKAYRLLQSKYGLPPLHFHLHKVIPMGAGLGGGSSDAAFTLKALNSFYQLGLENDELERYASKIGADCPFFIQNKSTFATGTGNIFHKIELDLSSFEIVVVKPQIAVSTPDAYKDVIPHYPKYRLTEIVKRPIEEWKNLVVNDFEAGIFRKFPEIAALKQLLYDTGAVFASMSGSGSSVYGIFRQLPANLENKIPKGVLLYR